MSQTETILLIVLGFSLATLIALFMARRLWTAANAGFERATIADIRTRDGERADLALRAAVDRNYISLIELGKSSPSLGMVYRLCDALDIRPADVLKEVDKRMAHEPGSK